MGTDPKQVYELFFNPGEVVEIRVLGLQGKNRAWDGWASGEQGIIGYFDNAEDFGEAARALDQLPHGGIFFTINPPDPAVLSRSKNKMVAGTKRRPATSNPNIRCIRWLYIDIDAQPLAGISSTDEELEAAYNKAAEIARWLKKKFKFPKPIGGMSGNGYHLHYQLPDLPNEDAVSGRSGLIATALAALAHRFNDEPPVHVDKTVFNAARICKLYGTMAHKGDDTTERPHRASALFESVPESLDDVPLITKKQLKSLAALAPAADGTIPAKKKAGAPKTTKKKGKTKPMPKEYENLGKLRVDEYLSQYGVGVHSIEQKGSETYYILDHCVFDSTHLAKDAAIKQGDDGTLRYTCFHDSCSGRTWKEARAIISGDASVMELHENFDPTFSPPAKSSGNGVLHGIEIAAECELATANGMLPPQQIAAEEFFERRGTRDVFVTMLLAKYLACYLAPVVCTSGIFWKYKDGLWKVMSTNFIKNMATQALSDLAQVNFVNNAVELLGNMVNREEDDWPAPGDVVNVANGVIDLRQVMDMDMADFALEKLLKPHDPKYGLRTQLAAVFDPDAECNEWVKALWGIFPEGRKAGGQCEGDDKVSLFQQYCGYVLMPHTIYQKCIFLTGSGANGKSTLIDAVIHVVGRENHLELGIDELAKSFNIPYLQGKMLITAAEMSSKEAIGIQNLKKCVSGDPVSGERKFGERVQFRNLAKFIFAMNNTPVINDKSFGMERRILSLTFNRRFLADEIDEHLSKKLEVERDGIFLWMLQGAVDLIRARGFREGDVVVRERLGVMRRLNSFLLFMDECCEEGEELFHPCMELYTAYQSWCGKSGLQALGRPKFNEQIHSSCPNVKKERAFMPDGSRPVCMVGIGLKEVFSL
jgi:P4 family phage/plasmid primase-like protien